MFVTNSIGRLCSSNKFVKDDFLNITKFNFAGIYYSPVKFSLKECEDNMHGPIISVSLFENEDSDTQNTIMQQFNLIDLSSK